MGDLVFFVGIVLNWFSGYVMAILFHEVGHYAAAVFCGQRVTKIEVWPRHAIWHAGNAGPRQRCAISLAGPFMNILLAAAYAAQGNGIWTAAHLVFAFINLHPTTKGSDGYNALRAWRRLDA